jgi:uncharacterized protein with HEPN domain
MPQHDDAVSLQQMLDHAREASDLVKEHGYDTIDLDILWPILAGDLPPLITALAIIGSPKSPSPDVPCRGNPNHEF